MSDQPAPKATDAEVLQMMIAEYTLLQSIRSGTIFDANGRINVFLGTVSSAVVALAFIGQISEMGDSFLFFLLILLPTLIFLGFVTFIRVNQVGIEDMLAARGINRIRHYYSEIAPHMDKYFILSKHDDFEGMMQNMGAKGSMWQQFVSTPGLVSVINSVLSAVFIGVLASVIFNVAVLVCIGVGAVVFAASLRFYSMYQHNRWEEINNRLKVQFPSEKKEQA